MKTTTYKGIAIIRTAIKEEVQLVSAMELQDARNKNELTEDMWCEINKKYNTSISIYKYTAIDPQTGYCLNNGHPSNYYDTLHLIDMYL